MEKRVFCEEKVFKNGLDMCLPLQDWVKKTFHGMEIQRLYRKENAQDAKVSKENYADSLLGHESLSILLKKVQR